MRPSHLFLAAALLAPLTTACGQQVRQGTVAQRYTELCSNCHGKNMEAGGMAPDLRTSPIPPSTADFNQVVHDGTRQEMGMPQFGELTPEQLLDMQHYIVAVARAAKAGKPNPYPAPDLTQ